MFSLGIIGASVGSMIGFVIVPSALILKIHRHSELVLNDAGISVAVTFPTRVSQGKVVSSV